MSAKVYTGDFAEEQLFVYGADARRSLDVWRVDVATALAAPSVGQSSGTWMLADAVSAPDRGTLPTPTWGSPAACQAPVGDRGTR